MEDHEILGRAPPIHWGERITNKLILWWPDSLPHMILEMLYVYALLGTSVIMILYLLVK